MSRPTAFPRPSRLCSLLALGGLPLGLCAQIAEIHFAQQEQIVTEHRGTVNVAVTMSRTVPFDLEIPFRLASASSATVQTDADAAGDFLVDFDPDDVDETVSFDPATGEGTLTLAAGVRYGAISLELNNDLEAEPQETIIFEFVSENITAANVVLPRTHTIRIQDNDTLTDDENAPFGRFNAYFEQTTYFVTEGYTRNIPVSFLGTTPEALDLEWELVFEATEEPGFAKDNDLGTTSASTLLSSETKTVDQPEGEDPITFVTSKRYKLNVGASVGSVNIPVKTIGDVIDPAVNPDEDSAREVFYVRLHALHTDTDVNNDGDPDNDNDVITQYAVDPQLIKVVIVDNDPTTVFLDRSEMLENRQASETIREGFSYQLTVGLRGIVEDDVEVPVSFGGTATIGTDQIEDGTDYFLSPDLDENGTLLVTIPAGDLSATFQITSNSDLVSESEPETIVVSLGTPEIIHTGDAGQPNGETTPLTLEENIEEGYYKTFTLKLEDVTRDVGFGMANPAFADDSKTEEELADEPNYVPDPDNTIYVAEAEGRLQIPIYFSTLPAANVSLELEIVSAGTTAKLLDINAGADQDYDFFIANSRGGSLIRELDDPTEVTFSNASEGTGITLILNNETEPALPYADLDAFLALAPGESLREFEGDDTIQLRIVQVTNTEDSGVTVRSAAAEFTVVIKEMPEIDLSGEFGSLMPVDPPEREPETGLDELRYNLQLNAAAATKLATYFANETGSGQPSLRGYTGFRLAFRPGRYDPENPDAATNDPVFPTTTPNGITPFDFVVSSPFKLRYPTSIVGRGEFVVEREGVPQAKPNVFTEENADVVTAEYSVLRPLDIPALDPDSTSDYADPSRARYFAPGDPMDFLLEFSNDGLAVADFDVSRFDPSVDPDNFRILLSRAYENTQNTSSFSGSFLNFEELPDGSVLLEFSNPVGSNFRIQYLDEDGIWKDAQPGTMSGSISTMSWIDSGPPKTYPHPREVDFRLYRITNQ